MNQKLRKNLYLYKEKMKIYLTFKMFKVASQKRDIR